VAATARPGLLGSLLVGLSFAKAFAWARRLPFIACDHLLAHLYAARLCENPPAYPYLGLLVSGGHTVICRADGFDAVEVLGTTLDDAAGEAFDKVAKHYGLGYPGGVHIDAAAKSGDADAFAFPLPKLRNGVRACDVSYSGLKTAVINQLEQFRRKGCKGDVSVNDIAAAFQKAAVDIIVRALLCAARETGIRKVVTGGGVAANSLLRARLADCGELDCVFPPNELCGDNGAMVAGLAFQYFARGDRSPLTETASARVRAFKH
jgi:N6-L-threonylcarbamoyladenine synthase